MGGCVLCLICVLSELLQGQRSSWHSLCGLIRSRTSKGEVGGYFGFFWFHGFGWLQFGCLHSHTLSSTRLTCIHVSTLQITDYFVFGFCIFH